MEAITHKFKAKFGDNKKKAWIVSRSVVGKTYEHWIHRVQSKEISGWDTAAHSRTARMYVVECEEYGGIKLIYISTDTRVGVTKIGKAYTSHKIKDGI